MKNTLFVIGILLFIVAVSAVDWSLGVGVVMISALFAMIETLHKAEDREKERIESQIAAIEAEQAFMRDEKFKRFMEETW